MEINHKRAIEMVAESITDDLKEISMYTKQHDFSIMRYAELTYMHQLQMDEFMETGMMTTTEHTNKGGATNVVKNPILMSLEKLRVDMLALENVLGLNPSALAKIQKVKGVEEVKPKMSAFDKAMMEMNNNDNVVSIRKSN